MLNRIVFFPRPGIDKEIFDLGLNAMILGNQIPGTMQSVSEWFACESQVICDGTNNVLGESRLLELSRTKEIASQDDRVIRVTGELEAAGDSIGNRALPRPRWTKEPVEIRTVWRVIFGPHRNIIQYTDTSSGGADFTMKQSSARTLENVIVVGDLRGFETLEE